jgi:hypothetical protein
VLDPAEHRRADGDPDNVPCTLRNIGASTDLATTNRAPPRRTRSCRSEVFSRVLAGMITAPSLMQARITSHNSTWLPSMTITLSPRRTLFSCSQPATWSDRADSRPYVHAPQVPSSSTMTSASRSGCSCAITSNHSSAQLNRPGLGHWKPAIAPS